jgi:TM2 domain-containing membrane protein YozV
VAAVGEGRVGYSIIGADDNEYGPVEVGTLVNWARDGRVVERTQIKDHESGRRFLACDMAELSAVFNRPAELAPRPVEQPIIPTYTSYPPAPSYGGRPYYPAAQRSRIVAGLLGIVFGWLGAHRFYLGYTAIGVIQLLMGTLLAVFTCGISLVVAVIWGAIEGIICLVGGMPDADGRPLSI